MSDIEDLLNRAFHHPDEPEDVAAAFRDYLDMGDARTYAAVARLHSVTRMTVMRWAKRYDWRERLERYERAMKRADDRVVKIGLAAVEEPADPTPSTPSPAPPSSPPEPPTATWTDDVPAVRRAGQIVLKCEQITEVMLDSLRHRVGLGGLEDRFEELSVLSLATLARSWVAQTVRLETSAELAAAIRDHGESQADAIKGLSDEELLALQKMQRKVRAA